MRGLAYQSNWNHHRLTSKMRPHLPLVKDIPNSERHKHRISNAIDQDDTSQSIRQFGSGAAAAISRLSTCLSRVGFLRAEDSWF